MGILAMHYTYNNLAKLELINTYADPTFFGQKIKINLIFDNQSQHDCYQIAVASKQNDERSKNPLKNLTGYHYHAHQDIEQLLANGHQHHIISVDTLRRGLQPLGRIRISSQFPFGLFETWTYFDNDCYGLVYPKPEGHLPLPSSLDEGQEQEGKKVKGLDDFAGFHAYRLGDPIHSVAWKAVARDDVLRTKQFTSSLSGELTLRWQDTASLSNPESRLSQLCRWVLDAEQSSIRYALELPNQTIELGGGSTHQQRCLTALALYE
jgi:uncharacterized protein (DUF58 family)